MNKRGNEKTKFIMAVATELAGSVSEGNTLLLMNPAPLKIEPVPCVIASANHVHAISPDNRNIGYFSISKRRIIEKTKV
jgi:hypothetical protein